MPPPSHLPILLRRHEIRWRISSFFFHLIGVVVTGSLYHVAAWNPGESVSSLKRSNRQSPELEIRNSQRSHLACHRWLCHFHEAQCLTSSPLYSSNPFLWANWRDCLCAVLAFVRPVQMVLVRVSNSHQTYVLMVGDQSGLWECDALGGICTRKPGIHSQQYTTA